MTIGTKSGAGRSHASVYQQSSRSVLEVAIRKKFFRPIKNGKVWQQTDSGRQGDAQAEGF